MAFSALLVTASLSAEETTTLQEVTVTASSDALGERQAAATQKTIIDRAEIEALGGLSIGETIRKEVIGEGIDPIGCKIRLKSTTVTVIGVTAVKGQESPTVLRTP